MVSQSSRQDELPTLLAGFLSIVKRDNDDCYIGAAMVTEEHGHPLEFRATTPVRPTAIQKTLFGDGLDQYISVELCGVEILRQLQRRPALIVVPSEKLLALSSKTPTPVVRVRRPGETLEAGTAIDTEQSGRLHVPPFTPIVWETRGADDHERQQVLNNLQVLSQHFDVVEVFDRIRAAVEILTTSDDRYK